MVESIRTVTQRRVLFVVPDMDAPPTKGYQVRCVGLAEGLSERYVSRIVAARSTSSVAESAEAARRPVLRLLSLLSCIANGAPIQCAPFDGMDVAQRIRQVVEAWKPEVIVVLTERLPVTVKALCSRALVVDVVDSMRLHMEERAARASVLGRLLWTREARGFARNAHHLVACATHVVAASTTALEDYSRAHVIPNAARVDRQPRPAANVDVVFTGNLSYWPNVKAALELCERIGPTIRQAIPRAVIVIAGRDPTNSVRRACATSGITLVANVDDMPALLRASRLALAPVEWTPGANLKILEALAAGTPVLAYPAAAQQLPGPVDGVRVCDGPDAMARAAVAYLNGDEVHAVSQREQHTWVARAAQLEALLDSVTGTQTE